jgi:hypothetical protein
MAIASRSDHDDILGTVAVGLGIAGLLPILPLIGSVAALVCGYVARHADRAGAHDSSRATVGIVLGWIGVAAPLVFLFVYCVVLGYPFPIHRYNG